MTNPASSPQWLPPYRATLLRQNGQQYYVNDRGDRLPSVTSILNVTRPLEQREALANWRSRIGVEAAAQISSKASRRGSGTHRQIQQYLEGKPVTCSEAVEPYWQSFQPLLETLEAVRLVEGCVVHNDLGYGGKVDCVATYQGIPCVCEWKTADRPKGSRDRLYDYPLQLAAYCGAVNHTYEAFGLNLTHGLLVVGIAHQAAEVFWFEPPDLATYWNAWQQRVVDYYQ